MRVAVLLLFEFVVEARLECVELLDQATQRRLHRLRRARVVASCLDLALNGGLEWVLNPIATEEHLLVLEELPAAVGFGQVGMSILRARGAWRGVRSHSQDVAEGVVLALDDHRDSV